MGKIWTRKHRINQGNLTSEQVLKKLENFKYPAMLDKNNKLLIDFKIQTAIIGFEHEGSSFTTIKIVRWKVTFLTFLKLILPMVILVFIFFPLAIGLGIMLQHILFKRFSETCTEINKMTSSHSNKEKINNTSNIDNLEQLEKLASLKEKGIISEEEFQIKKKELL